MGIAAGIWSRGMAADHGSWPAWWRVNLGATSARLQACWHWYGLGICMASGCVLAVVLVMVVVYGFGMARDVL